MDKRTFLKGGMALTGMALIEPSFTADAENLNRFTSNPQLETLGPEGWQGTPLDGSGRFRNQNFPFVPSFSSVLKWKSGSNPLAKEKASDVWKPELKADGDFLSRKDDCLVWLGHASFFIRMDGIQMLIDPVFGKATVVKRMQGSPYPAEIWKNLDYLLISHDHRDHCDVPSLEKLARQNPEVKVLSGLGMKKLLSGIFPDSKIEVAGWYQKFNSRMPEIWFMPSRHWSRRGLTDTNSRLWGGFYIAGPKRIYFMGDSGYDQHFAGIPGLHPEADLALMGIGAYCPEWFMHPSHMKPEDSWQAFLDLKAGKMLPMHFGTFDLSDEPASEPLRRLQTIGGTDRLLLPGIGETNWL